MFNRKEYDRKHQQELYAAFKLRRGKLLEKLGGSCYVCRRTPGRGLHLHHKYYHPTESNYPRNAKSMWTREKRLREAEACPDRFVVLCARCHVTVEGALKDGTPDFKRLSEVIKTSMLERQLRAMLADTNSSCS